MDNARARKTIKSLAATIVGRWTPGTFFLLASKEARASLSVEVRSGWIDIVDKKGLRRLRINRANSIYLPHLADCFNYFFGSATPIRIRCGRDTFDVVDFSTPRFQEVSGFPDYPILCPSFTEPFITTLQYLEFAQLHAGDVVLDLGCYSGLTSIAFSREVGASGKVVALEPDPISFAAAQNNIARHIAIDEVDNVLLLNCAVGSGLGVASFASDGTMDAADAAIVGSYRGHTVEVESLGLNDIADRCSLKRIDLIKMDIEGSELKVLAAAEEFFQRFRPKLIVEPHNVDGEFSEIAVKAILTKYRYRCETIIQAGLSWPLVAAVPQPE
jgi:FkbM family methyltransferase